VLSQAIFSPEVIKADGQDQAKLIITLRDWQNGPLTTPIRSLTVEHAPGSAGSSTIGPVQDLGDGAYAVIMTAGLEPGVDTFTVTADDGVRPVVLMPSPSLTLESGCYADCEQDGDLDIDDFVCFQTIFALGLDAADCDADGVLSIDDFICFQTSFAVGCP
jgi:hypothetical protein